MFNRRAASTLSNVLKSISRRQMSSSKPGDVAKLAETTKPAVTVQQSPNYPTTWSTSQRPRPGPGSGPRFEQTDMELQPNPPSAMEMIAQEPIRLVNGRKAVCDGGPYFS